jgi:DNA-binding MarR family transcriptional regulator
MRDQFGTSGRIKLEKAIAFWVERLNAVARAAMYARFSAKNVDMTPERWGILVRLWEEDGLSQKELAARTWKDEPTVSRILDGMAKKSWIVRRPSPEDARARMIHLTPHGKKLEAQIVPEAKKLVALLERGIPEADLAVTRRTLQRMVENISEE